MSAFEEALCEPLETLEGLWEVDDELGALPGVPIDGVTGATGASGARVPECPEGLSPLFLRARFSGRERRGGLLDEGGAGGSEDAEDVDDRAGSAGSAPAAGFERRVMGSAFSE